MIFTIIGVISAIFSTMSFVCSVEYAMKDKLDSAHRVEIVCILWLIVAILCFKG